VDTLAPPTHNTLKKIVPCMYLEDISREELKAKMERGEDFVLLEALPEKSYRRSHLPGAINLPLGQTDQAEEPIPRKETEVVV
jgi:rhodanese-related sulfurtransferase